MPRWNGILLSGAMVLGAWGCSEELPPVDVAPAPTAPTSVTGPTVPLVPVRSDATADAPPTDIVDATSTADASDGSEVCLAATPNENVCYDGIDNDCDGDVDLDDRDCWWDPAWTRRVEVTFDNTGGEPLTDFPVVLRLSSSGAPVNWGNLDSSGADVRIVDRQGTVYPHEIERWEDGNSQAWVWTKIPQVAAGETTRFYLYYGNPDAVDAQDASAVWSNGYAAVWHLAETVSDDSTGGTYADSTGNGNTGAQFGPNDHRTDRRADVIGACADFEGGAERIQVATTGSNLLQLAVPLTIEVRGYADPGNIDYPRLISGGYLGRSYLVYWAQPETGWGSGTVETDGDQEWAETGVGDEETWHHVAATYGPGAVGIVVDGATRDESTVEDLAPLDTDIFIGNREDRDRGFDGCVDEVRIGTVARSAAWHAATARNFAGTLLSYGANEVLP